MRRKIWVVAGLLLVALIAVAQEDDFLDDTEDFDAAPPGANGFNPARPTTPPGEAARGTQPPGTPIPPGAPGGFNQFGDAPGGPVGGGGSSNPGFDAAKKRKSDVKPRFSTANPEDINNENFPDLIDSFDYPNAEISDVIKAISELTGKNFIVDPGVRGKITIMAPTQITVAEAYKAFLSALAINGFSVVPAGKFLKIVQSRSAQRDSIDIYSGAYTPNTDQMITRIIQLKHISAAEFNKYLRTLTTKDGNLEVYEPTNTLILSDYGSNVERVMKIVGQIDVQGFEDQMAVIQIRHAKATDIADLIDQIINKGKSSRSKGGGFTAGVPRFGAPADTKTGTSGFSLVIPDERTNSIIIVGNKEGIDKVKDLIRKLDFNIPLDESGGVFVYYVKYGNAEDLYKTLSGITAGAAPKDKNNPQNGGFTPPPPPGFEGFGNPANKSPDSAGAVFGGDIKIAFNKTVNALVITASRQDYNVVKNVLKKIDIPRDQVYVEAVIMEMNVQSTQGWGLNIFQFDPNTNGVGRIGFGDGNLSTILNPVGGTGAILGFGSGQTFQLTGPNSTQFTVSSLMGFVNILRNNINVNILSTPQVLALDNEKSSIEVGETIPTSTETTQTAAGSQTGIKTTDATIKLIITPYINLREKSIRMDLEQSIKQLSPTVVQAENLAKSAVTVSTRALNSKIVVPDGDTAVLGGLITDKESTTVTKVPLLGDIPILGWLFKSQSVQKTKQNLVIFLTPRIVHSTLDHDRLVGEKLDKRIDFIKENTGGVDAHGKTADQLRKRRALAPTPKKL